MKTKKILYWVFTVWMCLGMLSSAVIQLMRHPDGVASVTHLGFPVYLLTILGTWKVLGVAAVLAPRLPLLKEWAYAGFFFVTSGALISHIVMSDPIGEVIPALLLMTLTMISWYLRPPGRRIVSPARRIEGV